MRIQNIGIDIDGTITEPYYWLPRANRYFNTQVKAREIKEYDIHKVLGIKLEEYDEFYRIYGKTLHQEAGIRAGAREVINRLYMQYRIHIISAREAKMQEVTLEWLNRYQIPMDSVSLLGSCEKVPRARALGCDIFIEDKYENAVQLAQAGIEVLLIDSGYNKGELPAGVTRVRTWSQIEKVITSRLYSYQELEIAL